MSFSEDSPFLLAMGGSKGKLKVSEKILIFCYLVEFCFPCVIDDNELMIDLTENLLVEFFFFPCVIDDND